MTVYWWSIHEYRRPQEGEVVNVWARDNMDGKDKQFLARYSRYTMHGKSHDVWTPVGDLLMFNSNSVLMWTDRLSVS